MEHTRHTDKFHHKGHAIERARVEQMARLKGFKNAGKAPDALWLKKSKAVQQATDAPYHKFTPREAP